ncbi:MAG TPA: A24 family peptidase [Acidimicrobiia bacterium]|nr:A24 family peptidase [Acidimicrobiia bacterium]
MILLITVLGLLQGPVLHRWAVAVGADRPFKSSPADPPLQDGVVGWRWRELALSLLVGLGYWGMANTLDLTPVLVAHLVMVSLTAMLVVTDFDHFRIPNRLLYPGGTIAMLLLAGAAVIEGRTLSLRPAFIGAAGYFTLLLLVYLAARGEGFGFGDVKLAVLLGFFAGFHSYRTLAYSLFITSLLGGIPALILLAMGRSRKTAIPYGPPLIFGTWTAIILTPYLLM